MVAFNNGLGGRCGRGRRKVLPYPVLFRVGIVAYALDDDAGQLIPDARALHLESNGIRLLCNTIPGVG